MNDERKSLGCFCGWYFVLFPLVLVFFGCDSNTRTVGWATGVTAVGANAPTAEIEQIYYLGVFDPQDQLPPEIYRIRVHGQASALSRARFASGWVPAQLVDSLSSQMTFDENGELKIEKAEDSMAELQSGRRLMQFGPEGFRPAPKNHRLVIVMGSSPNDFFSAIDETLGVIAQATQGGNSGHLDRKLFEALVALRAEGDLVEGVIDDTKRDFDL